MDPLTSHSVRDRQTTRTRGVGTICTASCVDIARAGDSRCIGHAYRPGRTAGRRTAAYEAVGSVGVARAGWAEKVAFVVTVVVALVEELTSWKTTEYLICAYSDTRVSRWAEVWQCCWGSDEVRCCGMGVEGDGKDQSDEEEGGRIHVAVAS